MKLHQFRHSAFCEKARLLLALKGISYSVVEVLPGLGQVELLRQSGQRQVPVLQDGSQWIADSTAIALYLERLQPQPPLLPVDPAARAEVRLLEDWADTTLATEARLALVQAALGDAALRAALLPDSTPSPLRQLAGSLPSGLLGRLGQLLPLEGTGLHEALEQLTLLLQARPWLVGDQLSLADLAVAAQLYPLRFPAAAGPQLACRGVPGIADQPRFDPLFQWRDDLYRQLGLGASPVVDAEPLDIPLE
ncbi:MAG: glutathione S-transferase family protein [Cyanobium sp.]|jgi:glutathione S-transferase|nr:glutathione S-transferase family protein [Synechococcaceae cyanobacterium]